MTTHVLKGTATYDSLTRTFGEGENVGNYFAFRMGTNYIVVRKDGSQVCAVSKGTGYEQITGRLPKAVSRAIHTQANRRFVRS